MSEKITLNKTVFDRNSFLNTIDTSFDQVTPTAPTLAPVPSVSEFFNTYQQIFYNGRTNTDNDSRASRH